MFPRATTLKGADGQQKVDLTISASPKKSQKSLVKLNLTFPIRSRDRCQHYLHISIKNRRQDYYAALRGTRIVLTTSCVPLLTGKLGMS